jgi:hypothetical protein|tara:strand:+ start:266 stop:832 length:567 start_codon:yes stop_codon:yes gene_type:complete
MQVQNENNIICSKENVILSKVNINDYIINLRTHNNNINLRNIINFNIYKILGEVNPKNIESCDMIELLEVNKASFLFKFKLLGVDIGIPKKYMYVETTCNQISDNIIEYTSINLTDTNKIDHLIRGFEPITSKYSNLKINLLNEHTIEVSYRFNIDINEVLPKFANNLIGLLMKKIFLNLKSFIENIQ